jgi:type IV pilus assembly protein PilC
MISSGVIVSNALKNVATVANNEVYRRSFEIMVKRVERGDSLSECFEKEKFLFPLIVRQMMKVGDETGEPEIVMNLLADFYESELDNALDTFSSLLEPLMIGVMGIVAGGVILAIFLPIYNLINKLM